jgi:hypothetical protein
LLLFRDHHASRVRGQVTDNTLTAAPTPSVTSNITTAADGTIAGPVNVESSRHYRIAGFVETSHGRVRTEVAGDIAFANKQTFTITAALYHQQIAQRTSFVVRTTRDGSLSINEQTWPLDVDFAFATNADGTSAQTTTIAQSLERTDTAFGPRGLVDFRITTNAVHPTDTLNFNAAGAAVSATNQSSSQKFFTADLRGGCFSRELTAAAGVLTAVTDGRECGR